MLNKTWHLPLFVQSKARFSAAQDTPPPVPAGYSPHGTGSGPPDSHNDGGSGQDRDWRAFFEMGRAWRGASEAMDAVYWVDELGLKETLKERAGMNTFLQLGHEVARYYPQMDKAVATTKKWLQRRGYYGDEDELVPVLPAVRLRGWCRARGLWKLHRAIGGISSW